MTAAAIMGSLVDVRNIGVHKSVRLSIEVPEELGPQVIATFGWPTGVNPVAVAIARLSPEAKEQEPAQASNPPVRARKSWDELPITSQIAIRCNEVRFQKFLREKFYDAWKLLNEGTAAERAAEIVRYKCGVQSRKDIQPGTEALYIWHQIEDAFQVWLVTVPV